MKYTIFEKSILFLLSLIALLVISLLSYKKIIKTFDEAKKEKKLNEDRERIKKGMQELYAKCDDLTKFENRLNCFRKDIIKYSQKNTEKNKEFVLVFGEKEYKVNSEEFDILLRIKIPKGYSVSSCSANAFFFDLNDGYFYFSQENKYVSIECSLGSSGRIRIIPKSKELQKESLKSLEKQVF